MSEAELNCIMKHFYEWWENEEGIDASKEECFWHGYKLCMQLNGLTKYVKDVENES